MQSACAVLYCHLWPVCCYSIFPYYIINGTIFGEKKLLKTKCVFWFSLQLLSETFLILKGIERDIIINVCWSSFKVTVIIIVRFLKKFGFSGKIKKNRSDIKFHENPPIRAIRTDRQTDMTELILFFLYGSTTLYRVLAFSTNFSFHPLLSCVRVFQFGTF